MKCARCGDQIDKSGAFGCLESINDYYLGLIKESYTSFKVIRLELCKVCLDKVERFVYHPECFEVVE